MNIRPVRLPPCAAGARPTIASLAAGSPNPATGRPQYASPRKRRGGSAALASRHSTSRGQRRQAWTSAASDSIGLRDFMSRKRITFALAVSLSLVAAGCGGGGGTPATESDKAADVQILNYALSRELTAIDAYTRGLPMLRGRTLAVGRRLRAQEQEHVDALTKAIRGLGGKTDAAPTPLDFAGVKSQAGFLAFAYELGNSLVRSHTGEIAKLATPWPRSLLTSIVASEAQQLVLLRQGLGAAPLASVPEAFESGGTPPPSGG